VSKLLPIIYPPHAVDISRLSFSGASAECHQVLRTIETTSYPVIVRQQGSVHHEELLTAFGLIRLIGDTFSWWLNQEQLSAVVLAARVPQYRVYITTRTESFIAAARNDLDFERSTSNRRFAEIELARLARELEEVRQLATAPDSR
jgi:hypothetical protein